MKKYLIKSALALFAGGLVISCAEKESEYVPVAQQKAKAFEDVFKEIYGDVDPYQDWGFSKGKITVDPNDTSVVVEVVDLDGDIAYTQTRAFNGMNVLLAFKGKTRTDADGSGEDKRLNEWGDPTKNANGKAYNVPPALTPNQCLRVQKYFQTHPNLTYVDPHYTTFFVQQVYKGGDDPYPGLSPEKYTPTAATQPITGSDVMDHLTFGLKDDGSPRHHCNDFNKGDWNLGDPYEVLNTGQSANDYVNSTTHVDGVTHPDKITLMVNSSTECVGYYVSNGSYQHNYCCALVGADVIDAWADPLGIGEKVDDDWHRSFVGLDYEALPLSSLKTGSNAKALDFMNGGTRYILYQGEMHDADSFTDFYLEDRNHEPIPYISNNVSNMTIARYLQYTQSNGTTGNVTKDAYNYKLSKSVLEDTYKLENVEHGEEQIFNLDMILDYISQNAYPTANNGNWVTDIGGRDYYFTDWIVTLTNAGTVTVSTNTYVTNIDQWTQKESGRVFCEDLGVAAREDLDYNDVVFDVTIWENKVYRKEWWEKYVDGVKTDEGLVAGEGRQIEEATNYYASVNLLAAGGTIPITVHDVQVHSQFVAPKSTPAAVETMINTVDENSSVYGSYDNRDAVQLQGTDMTVRNYKMVRNEVESDQDIITLKMFPITLDPNGQTINTIEIVSRYGTAQQVLEIKSERGNTPRKFMIPHKKEDGTDYPERIWASERKNISLAYPLFGEWAKGNKTLEECFFGSGSVNDDYIFKGSSNRINRLPLVLKAQRTIVTDGEEYLWNGSEEFHENWNLRQAKIGPFTNDTTDPNRKFKGVFKAGDRLRFYGENILADAWISVSIGDITPYFVDSEFPNYIYNAAGEKEPRDSGCVEVLLDESAAILLNDQVTDGKMNFTVQGRQFTLTGISWVEGK
jgi:hypothetical protein